MSLIERPGGIALFWPSAGLATGAVIGFGRRIECNLIIGVAIGTFIANYMTARNVPLSLCFASANALEVFIMARVVERFGTPFRLDTLKRVFAFFSRPA